TSCSRAYFRTEGIAITNWDLSSDCSVDFACADSDAADALSCCVFSVCSSFCSVSSSCSSSSSSSYPSASITINVSPTSATTPSSTLIDLTVPSTGEGISTTDLSL